MSTAAGDDIVNTAGWAARAAEAGCCEGSWRGGITRLGTWKPEASPSLVLGAT